MAQEVDIVLEGHQKLPQQQFHMTSPSHKALVLQNGPSYNGSHGPNHVQFLRVVKSPTRAAVEVKPIIFDQANREWIDDHSTFALHGRPDGHGYFELWATAESRRVTVEVSH